MTLPAHIVPALLTAPGFDEPNFCLAHESGEQVVSLRLNPEKLPSPGGLGFIPASRVPWADLGYYLQERPFFTFEPLLHAGAFYVQEASSMFLEQAIRQCCDLSTSLVALDLCAAPGGKSTHLLSLLSPESVLVSNELIRQRAAILEENLVKWGSANSIITNNDPRDFSDIGPVFDLLVIDAPCSGSGMFRKDPGAVTGWSTDLVNLCSQRQQRILADVWSCLKEDGVMVYSTCSYSVEENEQMADFIMATLGAESLPIDIPEDWNIVYSTSEQQQANGYRFYPDKIKGEGFYLAAFKKTAANDRMPRNKTKPKWEPVSKNIHNALSRWINMEDLLVVNSNDNLLAIPVATEKCLQLLTTLYIRKAGISLGKWAGKDLVPDHALALSQLLGKGLPVLELDRDKSLRYLRKEEIDAGNTERGWVVVQFKGQNLGWIKQLGNRSNNYYPKEWRILKQA